MQRCGGGAGVDDDIKKKRRGDPAQAAFPILLVELPAHLEKILHLLPEPCRRGEEEKERGGKGGRWGGQRKKKTGVSNTSQRHQLAA